jgi:hypothetical protein
MPAPTFNEMHIDQPLTNLAVAYYQKETNFIADIAAPIVPVNKQSNKYFVYDESDLFRIYVQKRKSASESAGASYHLSNDSYYCDPDALHVDIPWDAYDNADAPINPEQDATRFLMQQMRMKKEADFISACFGTGLWTSITEQTGVDSGASTNQFVRWNVSGSTPVKDIKARALQIQKLTGKTRAELTLIVNPDVNDALEEHADFTGKIQYIQQAVVTPDIITKVLGIKQYLVLNSSYNSTNQGQTASYAFQGGKNALLCYINPNPNAGEREPSAMYQFAWKRSKLGGQTGVTVKAGPIEWHDADRVEAQMAYDFKIVSNPCGAFMYTAVA